MRSALIAVCSLLTALAPALESQAQVTRRAGGGRRTPRAPEYRSATNPGPARRSSALDSRYYGVSTRQDQIRALLSATNPRYRQQYSLTGSGQPTLVEVMLDQRNLLSARSTVTRDILRTDENLLLGDSIDTFGRGSLPLNLQGSMASQIRGGESSTSGFLDLYENELNRRADEYFEMGAAFFRAGDLTKAKNYFGMDREVNRDQARAYVADVLCAVENRDMNRGYYSLIQALRRAKTGDDLKVEKTKFYPDPVQFDRTVNVLNVVANQSSDVAGTALLVAFYEWVDGDLAAAQANISKAMPDAAASSLTNKDRSEGIMKFARIIEEARSAPPSGDNPGTTAR